MHKNRLITCIVLCLCVLGIGAGVVYAANAGDNSNMYLAGQYFKAAHGREDTLAQNNCDTIAAEYNGHTITITAIEYQKKMNILRDPDTASSYDDDVEIINHIVENIILLEEAERLGCLATEAEIQEMIDNAKLAYSLPEGKEMMDAYCEGAGITVDEYYEILRMQASDVISRQKLKNEIGKRYCEENGIEFTNVNPPEEMVKAQESYIRDLFEQHKGEITYY